MYLESYDLIDGRKRNAENAYNRKSTLVYAKLIRDRIKKNSHINLNPPQWWHQKILKLKKNRRNIKIIYICSFKEMMNTKISLCNMMIN